MTVLYYVIRVGDKYLDTTVWGLLTDKQRDAFCFVTREKAVKMARAWRNHPDYDAKGLRVVRIVARRTETPESR